MQSSVIAVLLSSLIAAQQVTAPPTEVAHQVKKHLMSLMYYGPFDLITFSIDENNVVTLGGYVVYDFVKRDAEREAREVKASRKSTTKSRLRSSFHWTTRCVTGCSMRSTGTRHSVATARSPVSCGRCEQDFAAGVRVGCEALV